MSNIDVGYHGMDDILSAVNTVFRVPVQDLIRHKRGYGPTSDARQAAIWVARQAGWSTLDIAGSLNRDHATVVYGTKACEKKMTKSRRYKQAVDTVVGILESSRDASIEQVAKFGPPEVQKIPPDVVDSEEHHINWLNSEPPPVNSPGWWMWNDERFKNGMLSAGYIPSQGIAA